MSYVVKRKVRTYRKKFVLPVLTENGVMGGETFACACSKTSNDAYKIFNSGADGTANIDTYSNAAPQWLSFYNPVPLKVTKLRLGQVKNTAEQNNYYITSWKIQASDDGQDWADVWSGTATKPAKTLVAEIADSGYHKYYRIYVVSASYYSGYPRVFFYGVDFDAEAENAVFYDDIVKSYVAKRKVRKYYKKQYEDWTQPVLSSNGVIGGNNFAVNASSQLSSAYQAFNAFDNVKTNNARGNSWHSTGGFPQWIEFYNPSELLISNITIYNRTADSNGVIAVKNYQIQTLNNGVWTTILSGTNSNNGSQSSWSINLSSLDKNVRTNKRWRIYITSSNGESYAVIGEISITAQKATPVEVSATDDYDYYEDNIKSYVIGRK